MISKTFIADLVAGSVQFSYILSRVVLSLQLPLNAIGKRKNSRKLCVQQVPLGQAVHPAKLQRTKSVYIRVNPWLNFKFSLCLCVFVAINLFNLWLI